MRISKIGLAAIVKGQNTVIDLNGDNVVDGWVDGNNNRWYCSSNDIIAHNAGVDYSEFSRFLIYSGIGFNSQVRLYFIYNQ